MTLRCSFWGEVGVFPRKHPFHMLFISESRCPDLSGIPSSAHTSIPEVAWSSSHLSPVLGGNGGVGETAGLLQGAAVRFTALFLKFPGRIACLFP